MTNQTEAVKLADAPELIKKFEDAYDDLSKQNKRVCAFFIHNHLKAAFLTTAEVAEQAGVSPATVVRFAVAMGFSGYADLQKKLRGIASSGISSEVLRVSSSRADEEPTPLHSVAKLASSSLEEMIETIDDEAFTRAGRLLFSARKILVVGHKAGFGPAAHAAYVLSKVHSDVRHVSSLNEFDSFSTACDLGEEDVLLVFTVIYYPTATTEIMRLTAKKGVKIVLVSDFKTFAEAELASESILVPIRFHGFLDQMAPMLAVADALAYEVYACDEEKAKKRLKMFNAFNEEIKAFSRIGRFVD